VLSEDEDGHTGARAVRADQERAPLTGRPSRIFIWSPNYAPEPTGIPPLVTDAAEWLAGRGHEVDVATAVPNYPERRIARGYRGVVTCAERRGLVTVRRSWLRVHPEETVLDKTLYEASFASLTLPAAVRLTRWADVIVCVVPSLVAAACAAAMRRLGGPRLVIWLQDLVLVAAAALDGSESVRRIRAVEGATLRTADRLITCSPGFHEYLRALGVDPARVTTVYNWVDGDWIVPRRRSTRRRSRFLYAGNLGYTQGFDTLVDAARELDGEIEISIVGEGNAAGQVRKLAATAPNIRVRPPVPRLEYPELLASADCHLVLQRRVASDANFPSKIASYLASGRPIIASINEHSPAAETLRASGAALLVPAEEPHRLVEAMERLHRDRRLRSELGQRGRQFALETFGRGNALRRLEEAILT
jgi:colanic acid biosynthesis glycosyl transferase WcaI